MAQQIKHIFDDESIGQQYVSFIPETLADKKRLFNAINASGKKLSEMQNTPIMMKDVIVRRVELNEDNKKGKTDDVEPVPFDVADAAPKAVRYGMRVVIIDLEGNTYGATSNGIYNSICTLRSIFGDLHFDEGLGVMVKEISTKNGRTLTLNVIE